MLANTRSRLLIASVAIVAFHWTPERARASVQPIPLVPGVEPNSLFRVFVGGVEVPVGTEKSGGRVIATAAFQCSGTSDVRIAVSKPFSTCTIRPLRFALADSAKVESKGQSEKYIHFTLAEPRKLIIELDGLPPLVLISSPPDDDLPNPNDPNVLYFAPGVHNPGRIRVKSNQTVFLAAGAKMYGTIEGTCVENVRVTGRGHLYGTKHTNWGQRTYGIVFDRCRNVTVEKIGIRDCNWWTTEFLLCDGVNIRDINVFSFNRNNGGLMIDSCSNLVARDSLLMTMDDCICPHALNAAGNGEVVSDNMLLENLVLYNVFTGNAIRIGASLETSEVRNWTFRNIDVVQRRKGGAAIYSDHSDWAVVRNLVFENFTDEDTKGYAIDMRIDKTPYSCQTGYRDERGSFDGLYFLNVRSLGGKFSLKGFDADHGFENVTMAGCNIGDKLLKEREHIKLNVFVRGLRFLSDSSQVTIRPPAPFPMPQTSNSSSPNELVVDDSDPGFRSYGFTRSTKPSDSFKGDAHIGQTADVFGKYAAAIYEPKLSGRYEVYAYCGTFADMDGKAPWIVKHSDGYTRAYVNQNDNPGWHSLGTFQLNAGSDVRLVYPDYFEPTKRPVVADAVKFVRVGSD